MPGSDVLAGTAGLAVSLACVVLTACAVASVDLAWCAGSADVTGCAATGFCCCAKAVKGRIAKLVAIIRLEMRVMVCVLVAGWLLPADTHKAFKSWRDGDPPMAKSWRTMPIRIK